jgi:catechol 2,3-dioxygenase-like lactoylglutathione lyase family enzyme
MVPVSDQGSAIRFYTEVLGSSLVADIPFGEGERWVEVAPPGGGTALALVPPQGSYQPGRMTGIALASSDPLSDHAELNESDHAELKQRVDAAPMGGDGGVPLLFFFRDNNKNQLMVVQEQWAPEDAARAAPGRVMAGRHRVRRDSWAFTLRRPARDRVAARIKGMLNTALLLMDIQNGVVERYADQASPLLTTLARTTPLVRPGYRSSTRGSPSAMAPRRSAAGTGPFLQLQPPRRGVPTAQRPRSTPCWHPSRTTSS